MVVYLVRSFRTYARIRSLTTGTFNLVVKDRIAFRLSGAHPGLDGPNLLGRTQERIRLSSKLYNHIVRIKPCQPAHPTAFPRVFHIWNLFWIGWLGELTALSGTRRYGLPLWMNPTPMTRRTHLAQYRSGRQKIEKRS